MNYVVLLNLIVHHAVCWVTGVRRKTGYTDQFLVNNGAAKGSTIVMTPTGYMTEEAWIEMAPSIADGIRAMPVIVDNPDWWVVKIIDGFGPHTSSLKAMEIYEERKILLVKEEGDTSHVCQAYDQTVAKDDKCNMRDCLTYLRHAEKMRKNIVDGWDLVHVALSAVRELSPNSWVTSFKRVNLHPHHRVPFADWCSRISHFLQGGESFKPDEVATDTYPMLPAFWHGMSSAEKMKAVEIVKQHGDAFSTLCVKQLHEVLHVPVSDMQSLRICLELADEHPDHLTREGPLTSTVGTVVPEEVAVAKTNMADIADGLQSFQLHPTQAGKRIKMNPMDKFDHLVKLARRSTSKTVGMKPSTYLDIEYTAEQQKLLDPSPQDFMMHEIMEQAHGSGAKQALAKRKLDALGNVRGASGFANDEARLKRLRSQLQLAESLATIANAAAHEKAAARAQQTSDLVSLAPAAIAKLKEKKEDMSKLTKNEIRAIAFVHFGAAVLKESENKATLISQLEKLVEDKPSILPPLLAAAQLPAAAPRAEGRANNPQPRKQRQRAAEEDSSEEEDESEEGEDEDEDEQGQGEGVGEEGGGGGEGDEGGKENESEDDDEEEYFVMQFHDAKFTTRVELLVEWEGWPSKDDYTWEPISNLPGHKEAMQKFKEEWVASGKEWPSKKKK